MPSLSNLPNVRPSLLLDFANSGMVDPRISFSRATTGTRINAKGLMETVAANVPRIDYNPVTGACLGLLIEESRTNLVLQSAPAGYVAPWTNSGAFGNWLSVTTLAPTSIAPDGSVSGIKVSVAAGPGRRKLGQRISVAPGQTYVFSAYVEVTAGAWLLHLATGNNNTLVLENAVSVPAAPSGGGWSKVSVTYTVPATGVNMLEVGIATANNLECVATVWGAQLEVGAFPTSTIPTTTAAVTRSADLPQMLGINFSDWYNPSAGTVILEASRYVGATTTLMSISDGTTQNMNAYMVNNGGAAAQIIQFARGGVDQARFTLGAVVSSTIFKTAAAWALNDFALSIDGSVPAVDMVGIPAAVDRLMFSGPTLNAGARYIRRFAYYPGRLAEAQLQALTAP